MMCSYPGVWVLHSVWSQHRRVSDPVTLPSVIAHRSGRRVGVGGNQEAGAIQKRQNKETCVEEDVFLLYSSFSLG